MKLGAFVLGYHGCDRQVGEALIAGQSDFRASQNAHDWLGQGIYFWENNPERALEWARFMAGHPKFRKRVTDPFAVGAVIDLGNCLDLTEATSLRLVKVAYDNLPHPGEILRTEFLDEMKLTQYRLAVDTGIPHSRITAIVVGRRAITRTPEGDFFVWRRRGKLDYLPSVEELPNWGHCVVEERKILEYLLNSSRMPAAAKARFFLSCGFSRMAWQEFAESLRIHAKENGVVSRSFSLFGTKYEIEGPLRCPDGRSPNVRTVWQVDADGLAPRLITAYPSIR